MPENRVRIPLGQPDPDGPLQTVLSARAIFEDAVTKARRLEGPPGPDTEQFIQDTLHKFEQLLRYAEEREQREESFNVPEREAVLALSRRRAYVLPREELISEAISLTSEMKEWNVPSTVIAELEKHLALITSADEGTAAQKNTDALARSALNKLMGEYDYWDWYSDWYVSQVSLASVALGICALVALGAALILAFHGFYISTIIFGAACGAALSVLGKLPPMSVYGEAASLTRRMSSRLVSGIVASSVGMWLFTSGVINVGLGSKNLPEIAASCIDGTGKPCTHTDVLILLTLAVLLGFSERALSSFEKRLLPEEASAPSTPNKD